MAGLRSIQEGRHPTDEHSAEVHQHGPHHHHHPPAGRRGPPNDKAHYGVYDHGAHVFAWQPNAKQPVLWMSAASLFADGEPLRGGVPVIFPWFGTGPAGDQNPPHGFVRRHQWQQLYVDDTIEENNRLVAEYHLDLSKVPAQAAFPYAFTAGLRVVFTHEYVQIGLKINNADTVPFTFEEALHTYIAVSDVRHVTIDGLEGLTYLDRAANAPSPTGIQDGLVRIESETDRIYASRGQVVLGDPAWNRSLLIQKENSANTVVWNPWVEKAAAMPDFGDDEWTDMICIEAANVLDDAITLEPGETHLMRQRISLVGTRSTL